MIQLAVFYTVITMGAVTSFASDGRPRNAEYFGNG